MPYPPGVGSGTVATQGGIERYYDGVKWRRTRTRPRQMGSVLLIGDSLTEFNLTLFGGRSVESALRARLATATINGLGGRSMGEATPIITAMASVPPDVILQLVTNFEISNVLPAEVDNFTAALDTNIALLRARGALRIHLVTSYVDPVPLGASGAAFNAAIAAKNAVIFARAASEPDVEAHDFGAVTKANKSMLYFLDGIHHTYFLSPRFGVYLANLVTTGAPDPYATQAARIGAPTPVGQPRVWARVGSQNEAIFTNATAADKTWLNANLTGVLASNPSFDDKLSWLPDVMVCEYADALAIYAPPSTSIPTYATDSGFIAKAQDNEELMLPYPVGPSSGWTQFAPDVSSEAWWNRFATLQDANQSNGWQVWLDDVNYRNAVARPSNSAVQYPYTAALGQWTEPTWIQQMARYMIYLRHRWHDKVIVHNTQPLAAHVWMFDDNSDARIIAQQSDFVQWEFGFTSSTTNGSSTLRQCFDLVDRYHSIGVHSIFFSAGANEPAELEKNMACYMLVADGLDCVGDSSGTTMVPFAKWAWYAADYGTPSGPRYEPVTNLWRRDFSAGIAIMNRTGADYTLTTATPYKLPGGTTGLTSRIIPDGAGVMLVPE